MATRIKRGEGFHQQTRTVVMWDLFVFGFYGQTEEMTPQGELREGL